MIYNKRKSGSGVKKSGGRGGDPATLGHSDKRDELKGLDASKLLPNHTAEEQWSVRRGRGGVCNKGCDVER